MTAKKKTPAVKATPDLEHGKMLAKASLSAAINSAAVVSEYGKPFGELDVNVLADRIAEISKDVSGGDMSKVEYMLIDQAHALQSMFMSFSRRALNQEYQSNLESFFKMALKAQNQCRMTLETLATIKNPPVIIAKQANVTTGPQQVNNGIPANSPAVAHAEENRNRANELLSSEVQHGEKVDPGRTGATSDADKAMATVGQIDRPEKP
ncbi:MAG: hypothetical protein KGI54_12635 [Pseudomonadota bacterium]|nr:hypothetical protein [Pseudomonadota bacterium]